mgnify:CR=1 FL=1
MPAAAAVTLGLEGVEVDGLAVEGGLAARWPEGQIVDGRVALRRARGQRQPDHAGLDVGVGHALEGGLEGAAGGARVGGRRDSSSPRPSDSGASVTPPQTPSAPSYRPYSPNSHFEPLKRR